MPDPLLLAVDGNSLLHRAHHAWAGSQERDRAGRPIWALIGVLVAIAGAAARCRPDGLVVGFDCDRHSIRREAFPLYKAHRPDKPPELRAQLERAPRLLAEAGLPVVQVPGHEADDVLASAAAGARRAGWHAVLVTSDRDAFALIEETTSVLRVVNGGIDDSPLLTPASLATLYGVEPQQYGDLAALRGDPSDNLRGVTGVGTKTAARLLAAFGSLDAVYRALEECRDEVSALVGDAVTAALASPEGRSAVRRNRDLMALSRDLPMPAPEQARLPLDAARLRNALAAHDIRLGPSLWALVGGSPPTWPATGYDRAPSFLPRAATPPWELSQWYRAERDSVPVGTDRPGATGSPVHRRQAARRPGRARPVLAGQLTLF